jgi:RHS repeat-associated protein
LDGNGSIDPLTEIKEENHYYPFGLKHKGYNNQITGVNHPYGYGGKEENDELGLEWLDFHARNYDASIGRWMNIDPHADNYYNSSPYTYALNNPLYFVDPDGKDNIVYLVLLESADRKQMEEIVKATNQRFHELKLNTRVQIYEGEEMFDSSNLDSTDSFGVVGTTKEISKLFKEHGDNFKGISGVSSSDLNDSDKIELANKNSNGDGTGTGFLIKTETLGSSAETLKTTENDVASHTILHALGHNAGSGHSSTDQALMASGGLLGNTIDDTKYWPSQFGGRITGKIDGVSSFKDIFTPSLNTEYSKLIRRRMGENKATDNYKSNSQMRREKTKGRY